MSEKAEDNTVDQEFLAKASREVSALAPRLDAGSTVRLAIGPVEEFLTSDSPDFVFKVFVMESKTEGVLAVITDLQRTVEEQFLAVSTLATLRLDAPPEGGLNEDQGTALGHWAAQTVYGTAAMNLRVAAANHSSVNDLNLPLVPDDYEVRFWTQEMIAAEAKAAEEAAE